MSKENQNETNILDVLIAIARHKLFLLKVVLSITIIALIISLLWPQSYKSTSTFVPVTNQRSLPGGISGLLGGGMQLPTDFPQLNPELIISILRSRELREAVINEFDLREAYNTDLMEALLIKLDQSIQITENREGGFGFNAIYSISLSIYNGDPETAYAMNRFILGRLDQKIREINMENSSEQMTILENRYLRNLEELKAAEEELLAFQEKYGIIEVEEQARQVVSRLGELKAGSIQTEMNIAILRQSVSENNVELRNLIRTKEEFDRQYQNLMRQSDRESAQAGGFYPLLDLPELGITYFRLFREVEIQSKILEAIYPQVESQKMVIEANRRGIQIIDHPVIPTYKDGPKRAFIVLAGIFFSIFLALTIIFFREMIDYGKRHNTENYRRLQELSGHLSFRKARTDASSES